MLSKKTKYAINALVYLAKNEEQWPISIQHISSENNIPYKFLESIMQQLKQSGIVQSKKGKTGGYALLKSTAEINLAEVMRLFDGPIALLPCATYQYYERCEECKDEVTCGIRQVMIEIRNDTVKKLKDASLESILHREDFH